MRRVRHFFTFATAFLMLSAPAAMAMSFGRTATATTLGQRLDFIAQLALDGDETLERECVAARVMAGDDRVGAENVRVTLESASEPGMRAIRVTTRTAIDEPVVTIDLTVGCRSQMSRRFVAFIDPPALRLASAETEKSLPPQRVDPQVAPLLEIVTRADRARALVAARGGATSADRDLDWRRRTRRIAPGRRFAAAAASELVVRPRQAAAARKSASAQSSGAPETPAARATPRLRLDAAAAFAAAPPSRLGGDASPSRGGTPAPAPLDARSTSAKADAATEASLASAAAALEAASAAFAQERAHFQELEAGLARLRGDSLAQQKTIGALQVRLRQAEGDRYLNGLVYALAAALLFFALLAAAFWALRPRQRRRARWFDAQAQQRRAAAADAAATASRSALPTQAPAVSQHPSQWPESAHAILPVTQPATIGGLEVTTVLAPQSHYARMADAGAPANAAAATVRRGAPPSMEELIDLEQQAEFYVVLGQDEAAIALLTAHLGEVGAASPLPFLQLLEIHQRRGDRASYEALREDYQDHFDALAPEWSNDLHFGRSLEAYPQTVARLQALWPTPLHAMRTLDGLLFRRNESDDAFDFPAYRELLFLYSIARELAGQVETDFGTIDLFLPLDDAAEASTRHDGRAAVDLDVSGWPEESRPEGLVIRRSAGRRGGR
jgi:hypothetical protein